jgi:hypothetical protein
MKKIITSFLVLVLMSCNDNRQQKNQASDAPESKQGSIANSDGHYEGAFTNGMKETFISFDISGDGQKLENLTFKGYWRCDGKLEQTTLGPEKDFTIVNNKVDGHITEPEDGGATAIRYEVKADIKEDHAEGSFRMNINALACDTYVLQWKAEKK